jgi:glycosyltransferase involved in cell wall biosynthesis
MIKTKYTMAVSSSSGAPRNPKTWSGTPSNIIKALERQGIVVLGINSGLKKYQKLFYLFLYQVLGLGIDYHRGPIARAHSAMIVQRQSKAYGCRKILHTGTLDLPMPKPNAGVDHYLFCDSTWNLWSQYATNIDQYSPRMLQFAEKLERKSYAQIKHFFPISDYVRDNLINHYGVDPKRITVVGTGRGNIEPYFGEKNYRSGHVLFVAKGRFEDKGGPLLLESFKIAQRRNQNIKLIVVGDDKYRNLTKSVPNVISTGYIPWEELQRLFHTAALFAMPSLNEPWGLVYLEALTCKTPILGLNRNSLPEITRNGQYGFLVDEPVPDRIADAIIRAFSNPDKLREMGTTGQKYCLEKFSWNRTATKITDVILGTSEGVK